MKAIKGNKVYSITEKQKKAYTDAGFDILDDAGAVVAYGRGKTVPYGDYMALKAKNDALKAENDALKAENETLKAAQKTAAPETKAAKK